MEDTLEDYIMSVSLISEDIKTITSAAFDRKTRLTDDQLMNLLIGARELHEARWNLLWDKFEEMIKSTEIKEKLK